MAETNKTGVYLNIILTLCTIIIGVLTWVMNGAIERNDRAHTMIQLKIEKKADAQDVAKLSKDVISLQKAFDAWCKAAPPKHIHADDKGTVYRVP